jgi:hypothetical protein
VLELGNDAGVYWGWLGLLVTRFSWSAVEDQESNCESHWSTLKNTNSVLTMTKLKARKKVKTKGRGQTYLKFCTDVYFSFFETGSCSGWSQAHKLFASVSRAVGPIDLHEPHARVNCSLCQGF